MANPPTTPDPGRRPARRGAHRTCAALLVTAWLAASAAVASAQPDADELATRKAGLEILKLEAEVERLRWADPWTPPYWLTVATGLVTGVAGTLATLYAARLTRFGVLDQAVHAKRLDLYPLLVNATEPLAVFFPTDRASLEVDPGLCARMGRDLSRWYFGSGGLLLSQESRDAYFRLARGLTRASLADALSVPTYPDDAERISVELLERYRDALRVKHGLNLADIDNWTFQAPDPGAEACVRFKDFLLLQSLTSALRTKLSEDLRSRRRPQ